MKVTYAGFGPRTRTIIEKAVDCFSNELMLDRARKKLCLHIEHQVVPLAATYDPKDYGECHVLDPNKGRKPRSFLILLFGRHRMEDRLDTLAHELVHVTQWATGRRKDSRKNASKVSFDGLLYDLDTMDYHDQPWEREAYAQSVVLMQRFWTEHPNLANRFTKSLTVPV